MSGAIADVLAGLEGAPDAPAPDECAMLLEHLAGMVERGGPTRFLRPPVALDVALRDPRTPTPFGIGVALLRLFDHAGLALDVRVRDDRDEQDRHGAVVETRQLHLVGVKNGCAAFAVVGTIGSSFDVLHAAGLAMLLSLDPRAPYRDGGVMVDLDLMRRSEIAAVYGGLGVVLAARAHRKEPGFLGDDALAFLLAVQAIARDDRPSDDLPHDLLGAAIAWCEPLVDRADALRAALGVGDRETWGDVERAPPAPLARRPIVDGAEAPPAVASRHIRKTGAGAVVGGAVGTIAAVVVSMPLALIGAVAVGVGAFGAWIGHGVAYARCTGCGAVLADRATICTACGGAVAR